MRPSPPVPQQPNRSNVDAIQKTKDQKLVRADVGVIAGTASLSLAGLIALAYYWITASSVAVPFVVGAALPLFTLFAVIYQAVVYHRQWTAMERALKQTDRVIEKMQAQLDGIDRQAKAMEDSVVESRKLVAHSEQAARDQLLALQGQWKAMDESLEETRRLVAQNERAVKAAEDNAAVTKAAAAPYFGIIRISFSDFVAGRCPGLDIVFMNGGKTPAWHFYAMPVLVLGDTPESDKHWHFRPSNVNMAATFIPAERAQTFQFTTDFVYTEEWRKAVEGDLVNLFVIVTIEYRDHRNVRHPNHTFKCIWDRQAGVFRDFESA